jgi:hypothetical protein
MSKFNRIATVQFAVYGTDQTVTVSDLPYVWDDANGPIEQQAIFDACNYLRSIGVQRGLSVICAETRPNMQPMDGTRDCPECDGIGHHSYEHEHSDGTIEPYELTCKNCAGTGTIIKEENERA